MTYLVAIVIIIALVVLVAATFQSVQARYPRHNLVALGLALFVLGYLLQYLVLGQVHYLHR